MAYVCDSDKEPYFESSKFFETVAETPWHVLTIRKGLSWSNNSEACRLSLIYRGIATETAILPMYLLFYLINAQTFCT